VRRALVVEQNHAGQLHRLLRADCDLPCTLTPLHRPGALQWTPDDVHRELIAWSRA